MAENRPKPRATVIPVRERPTNATAEEEVGTELKLGDFADVPTLSISEARYIIEHVIESRRQSGKRFQETEVLNKMRTYMDTFARFKEGREQLDELETMLKSYPQLEFWEKSQLISLCPQSEEEARALVPSLADKMSEDDLTQVTDDLMHVRTHGRF